MHDSSGFSCSRGTVASRFSRQVAGGGHSVFGSNVAIADASLASCAPWCELADLKILKIRGQRFVVRREWYLRNKSLLMVEGKLALPSICDDLFAWSSLLERYPALRHLLQILNKFLSAERPASMRALADDSQPRFCLACSDVFPPSCMSPLLAPRLQRQRIVVFFSGAVTGCAGRGPQFCLQYQTGSHRIGSV